MADTVYLIPGGGLYKDTEQDDVKLVPGTGLWKEQAAAAAGGSLPSRVLTGPFEGPLGGPL
jgi:hypothetical protein